MHPYDHLWKRAALLIGSHVCVFSCVFVIVQYGVPGKAWWLIVLIHDICLRPYICISIDSQASEIIVCDPIRAAYA